MNALRLASLPRRLSDWLLGAGLLLAAGGCASVHGEPVQGDSWMGKLGYYAQSVRGHLALMNRARPVSDWLTDPATPAALRERLALSQRLRDFASVELALPDNASYRRYADLGRSAVVWNVVAAPELSLKLKTWCFAFLGCVGYRGYFDRDQADALADGLKLQGLEVRVYGVPAYSTLGWTNWLGGDPLLNTFIHHGDAYLARLVFHELAHQVVYATDDTMFNESYATAVERLGLARWQAATGGAAEDAADATRRADFRALTLRTRGALKALYDSDLPAEQMRQRKAQLMQAMRDEHALWKAGAGAWSGYSGYDNWMQAANNGSLALQAAYDELVPAFLRLYQLQGGDFKRFHVEVARLAGLPAEQRRATLDALQLRVP